MRLLVVALYIAGILIASWGAWSAHARVGRRR